MLQEKCQIKRENLHPAEKIQNSGRDSVMTVNQNRPEKKTKTDNSGKTGKVWLAGAGPGDAGLLTVKAAELIERADVIVYDALISA